MVNSMQLGIKITADGHVAVVELGKTGRAIDELTRNVAGAKAATERMTTSFGRMGHAASAIYLATQAMQGLSAAVAGLPRQGLSLLADVETTQIGLAGILSSMTQSAGAATRFSDGLAISADMIRKLNDDALRTAATSQELVNTFQAILAPGLAAGMDLDQIRQLAVVGTNAVKSVGLDARQIVQEIRDLVGGGITAASSTLATALGLKDEDIARARSSSEGLFAFLMQRLDGFSSASQSFGDTLTGRLAQMGEGATRVAAEGLRPLFEALSEAARAAGEMFVTIEDGGAVTLNPQLVESVRELGAGAAAALRAMGAGTAAIIEYRDAIAALALAAAAAGFGRLTASIVAATSVKIESANASRLAAAMSAAEAQADQAVVLSSGQKLAAYLAQLAVARDVALNRAARLALQEAEIAADIAQTSGMARLAAVETSLLAVRRQRAAADEALTLAETQLAAATRASSVATTAAGGVLAALGGPIGAVVTVLGAAAAAWVMFGDKAKSASEQAVASAQWAQQKLADLERQRRFGSGDLATARQNLEAAEERAALLARTAPGEGTRRLLEQARKDVETYRKLVEELEGASGAAGRANGSLGASMATLEGQYRRVTAGVSTAASVQDEYTAALEGSRRAYVELAAAQAASGSSDADLMKLAATQDAVELALAKRRDKALAQIDKDRPKPAAAAPDAFMDREREVMAEIAKLAENTDASKMEMLLDVGIKLDELWASSNPAFYAEMIGKVNAEVDKLRAAAADPELDEITRIIQGSQFGREMTAASQSAMIDRAELSGRISKQMAQTAREAVNGFDTLDQKVSDSAKVARELGLSFSSAFEAAVIGGQRVSDVLRGLGRDLLQLVTRKLVTEPMANAVTGALSGFSWAGVTKLFAGLFHQGGVPGIDPGGAPRLLPASLIPPAPRFHTGLMPNEFAAVLEKGEGVFTQGQMAAIGRGLSRGDTNYNVSIAVDANGNTRVAAPREAADFARRLEGAVKQVLLAESRPGGMLARG